MASILLVEDSATQAQELAFILEDAGFQVEIAADAAARRDLLSRGTFDLVLTDLFLPGESGIDLCRQIKSTPALSGLPVILLTRSADPIHLLRGLEAGAADFMTKDHEPAEIADRILRALARPESADDCDGVRQLSFRGEVFALGTERERLFNVLLSAFEDLLRASEKNQKELVRRMRAEDELRRAQAELERKVQERTAELAAANRDLAHQNEENEMFVYSVSHDLRSPLVNLQGFSQELGMVCRDLHGLLGGADVPPAVAARGLALLDGEVAESLRFIQASVMRLSDIIDALLKLSRVGRVEYEWLMVDLNVVVDRIIAAMNATIEERGARVTRQELLPAWGNPTGLEQVFANLIGNALHYLDPKRPGRIEVGMREPTADERANQRRTYYVQDNGVGIPEAYQAKVFQAFQRLRPEAAKGEGIGLTIVSRILERHHGRVWVESRSEVGSTFFISLAVSAQPALSGRAGNPDSTASRERTNR